MKNILIVLLVGVALTGCGKSGYFGFTSSTTYTNALEHTKRIETRDNFESRMLLSATYLNAIYPENYNKSEFFLIGIYISNDFKKELSGINNPNYKITLNDNHFSSAKELGKDDPLLKKMPLINRWSTYYVVSFAEVNGSNLSLSVKDIDINQTKTISFTK